MIQSWQMLTAVIDQIVSYPCALTAFQEAAAL